jgi:hypothetical protein
LAFTLTTQNFTGESGEQETAIIVQDTNSNANDEQPTAVAIDYSSYFARIATALETIAEQITPLITDGNGERFADQIARLRYLADPELDDDSSSKYAGSGIRTSQPYSPILNAMLYKSLILEGRILVVDDTAANDLNVEEIAKNFNDITSNARQVEAFAYRRIQDLVDSMQTMNRFK